VGLKIATITLKSSLKTPVDHTAKLPLTIDETEYADQLTVFKTWSICKDRTIATYLIQDHCVCCE